VVGGGATVTEGGATVVGGGVTGTGTTTEGCGAGTIDGAGTVAGLSFRISDRPSSRAGLSGRAAVFNVKGMFVVWGFTTLRAVPIAPPNNMTETAMTMFNRLFLFILS
jgi:hypothetical protein